MNIPIDGVNGPQNIWNKTSAQNKDPLAHAISRGKDYAAAIGGSYYREYLAFIRRPFANRGEYTRSFYAWDREYYYYRELCAASYGELALSIITDPRAKFLGRGTSRACYQIGNLVFKIPNMPRNVYENQQERALWAKSSPSLRRRLAPCWLTREGILIMRMVHIPGSGDAVLGQKAREQSPGFPEWAKKLDCAQAGLYKGRWVAYDYGYETSTGEWSS
jgi:hypothetical protein